jgi:hypothetical protein
LGAPLLLGEGLVPSSVQGVPAAVIPNLQKQKSNLKQMLHHQNVLLLGAYKK